MLIEVIYLLAYIALNTSLGKYLYCDYFVITIEKIMKVSIIKIGNSKGLRLNKSILERYNIRDAVELILEKGRIILKPLDQPRKGWDEAFRKMHTNQDDTLLIVDVFEDESFD